MGQQPVTGLFSEIIRRDSRSEAVGVPSGNVYLIEFFGSLQHRLRQGNLVLQLLQQAQYGVAAFGAVQRRYQRFHRLFCALLGGESAPLVITCRRRVVAGLQVAPGLPEPVFGAIHSWPLQ